MLTDEQIKDAISPFFQSGVLQDAFELSLPEYRAIEAEACKERDARIAELESQLEDARTECVALRVNEMNLEAAIAGMNTEAQRAAEGGPTGAQS
jgi:septal ring factor EnvC (AmiA/AmiB activator)